MQERYSAHMAYLLVGNYGVGNLGDEALREYFLRRFSEVEWHVVSAHPRQGELPRFPGGVRSLLSFRWLRTFRALRESRGIVLGGGSLFTDAESVRACVLWWMHVFFARILRKRIILAFQGIGPFETEVGEWFARSAIRSAHFVSVRDPQSYERARGWRGCVEPVETFDPVLLLVEEQKIALNAQGVLVIVPRGNSDEALQKRLNQLLQSGRFEEMRILSLNPDAPGEQQYCKFLQGLARIPSTVVPVRSLRCLASEMARGSFVLTQRYHGAVVALALGLEIEAIPQVGGDKLDVVRELTQGSPTHGRKERLRQLVERGESALREIL